MSQRLVLLGEGDGEVNALPILASRLLTEIGAWDAVFLDSNVIRLDGIGGLHKNDFEKWKKRIQYAVRRQNTAGLLVVLDGDDDYYPPRTKNPFCAATVSRELVKVARQHCRAGQNFSLAVVVARVEYESWLIAGARSLAGKKLSDDRSALMADAEPPPGDLEVSPRGAKEWLRKQMPLGYKESIDQAELTKLVDIDEIRQRNMRSFRRLEHALSQLLEAVKTGRHIATPN